MANTVVCYNCNQNLGPRAQALQPCPRCGSSGVVDAITHDWRTACMHRIKSVRPDCLTPFNVGFDRKPGIEQNGHIYSAWNIACACGSAKGKLLGYKTAHDEYLGAPLAFECAACGKGEELLDLSKHGYGSKGRKVCSRAGDPSQKDRTAFACPSCTKQVFTVSCVFIIPDAAFDLVEDDLLEQTGLGYAENIQNLFDQFSAECTCAACSTKAFAAGMVLK